VEPCRDWTFFWSGSLYSRVVERSSEQTSRLRLGCLRVKLRLKELADVFAVAVGGFSVMDNHLHVLVLLDPDVATAWSHEEVVRRPGRLFPPRDKEQAVNNFPVWHRCRVFVVGTLRVT
jgi:REP element-mobilizing transposase RayT